MGSSSRAPPEASTGVCFFNCLCINYYCYENLFLFCTSYVIKISMAFVFNLIFQVIRDAANFTYVNRLVSKVVFEVLGLEIGPQSRLFAVEASGGFRSAEKVLCAARAWKESSLNGFVSKFKFCYDDGDDTVYCLAHEDGLSDVYVAWSFQVGNDLVSFHKVSCIFMRPGSIDKFYDFDIQFQV